MTPLETYRARLEERRAESARWRRQEERLSTARLGVAILFVVLIWLAAGPEVVGPAILVVPVVAFVALVVFHQRAGSRRQRSLRAEAFYEQGLRRLEDGWAGTGNGGERFLAETHPYARDLDLLGKGSLFERVCDARTRAGEETLADWLAGPADVTEIGARQEAIRELAPRLDLREEIALLGEEVRVGIRPDELGEWGSAPSRVPARWLPVAAAVLAVAAVVSIGLGFLPGVGYRFAIVVILLECVLALACRKAVTGILEDASRSSEELDLLARLLHRVETEPFAAPRLAAIREGFRAEGDPPSRRIARLRRLVRMVDARRNQLFAPVALVLLWGTQLAFAIERWRARSGAEVARWLTALGELEAMLSLAGYAGERPDDPYPTLVEGGPAFEGEALGHPLLPEADCVRNDVAFANGRRLFLISGSNMSGKSTLLRTVGVNAVLALAGAPVRARSLRLSRIAVAASMRTQDSLLDGRSRFYAEIERLRQVVDLAEGDPPVLFLLDELLHGTNSHDRAIGSDGVIRGLLDRGAIGLVTTHDLALARTAEDLGAAATNVHFEDRLEEGRMVFDYRLRPGVVTKSNALDLMRAVGLDV